MLRTEAIKAFLDHATHADLASMYNHNMECQVNVVQGTGEVVEGEYNGRLWRGFTDGLTTWKSFRIPYNANSVPEYNDIPMAYDLSLHAEGVGMTGWDWVAKRSRWVAFDFDAITGHSNNHTKKLTVAELEEVNETAVQIPWVTSRLSTSGRGLHLYIALDVATANHKEHQALARSVLGMMSAMASFDFNTRVDVCGGNMWVWHRKMVGTDGLKLIKQGVPLVDVPINWRDHVPVVNGQRRRVMPSFVEDEDPFKELAGQHQRVKLDDSHKALINELDTTGASFWWDNDHHMLVCHTYDLAAAHAKLSMRGVFKTVATGREQGMDHNCFLFPMKDGAWSVRRYSQGTQESETWDQDKNGYTRCYYNHTPDLKTAARCYGAIEATDGSWAFGTTESAVATLQQLGVSLDLPEGYGNREVSIKTKDKKLIVTMDKRTGDTLTGWLETTKGKWSKVAYGNTSTPVDVANYDDTVRHIVTTDKIDAGWVVMTDGAWNEEPLSHVRTVLSSFGLKAADINTVLGNSVMCPWKLCNLPFQPEYPGDRLWNRFAAQLMYPPNLKDEAPSAPTWDLILRHVGSGLDTAVASNEWCRAQGVLSGAEYLKCWIASMFQYPFEPLPFLFLFGDQNTGKSILHEALSLLMTSGYKRADQALTSSGNFNGELENAILCIVEETDLRADKNAYNRIKDFVTALHINIHYKGRTPYMAPNTTHWIQCSNDRRACPTFEGDTRIVMINVPPLQDVIPKRDLIIALKKEASDFLGTVFKYEVPETQDRLRVPVIVTQDKLSAEEDSKNTLQIFLDENCHLVDGHMVSVAAFHAAMTLAIDPAERGYWTKHRISKEMPTYVLRGRGPDNQFAYGNISLEPKEPKAKLSIINGRLV